MAHTFRDRQARGALSYMAQVWLRLADNCQDAKQQEPRPGHGESGAGCAGIVLNGFWRG